MSLMCPACGLPTVPFGGEDICLDPTHKEDYSPDDDGDSYEYEDNDEREYEFT